MEEADKDKAAARAELLGLTAGCSWHIRLAHDAVETVGEFWLDWRTGHVKYGEGVLTGPTYQDGKFKAGPWAPVRALVDMMYSHPGGVLNHLRHLSAYAWHRNLDPACEHDWEATLPGVLSIPVEEKGRTLQAEFILTLRRTDDPDLWEPEVRPEGPEDFTAGWPKDWPRNRAECSQMIDLDCPTDPSLSAVLGVRYSVSGLCDIELVEIKKAINATITRFRRRAARLPDILQRYAATAAWHPAGSIGQNDSEDAPWGEFAEASITPEPCDASARLEGFLILRRARPESLRICLKPYKDGTEHFEGEAFGRFMAEDVETMRTMKEDYTLP